MSMQVLTKARLGKVDHVLAFEVDEVLEGILRQEKQISSALCLCTQPLDCRTLGWVSQDGQNCGKTTLSRRIVKFMVILKKEEEQLSQHMEMRSTINAQIASIATELIKNIEVARNFSGQKSVLTSSAQQRQRFSEKALMTNSVQTSPSTWTEEHWKCLPTDSILHEALVTEESRLNSRLCLAIDKACNDMQHSREVCL